MQVNILIAFLAAEFSGESILGQLSGYACRRLEFQNR